MKNVKTMQKDSMSVSGQGNQIEPVCVCVGRGGGCGTYDVHHFSSTELRYVYQSF